MAQERQTSGGVSVAGASRKAWYPSPLQGLAVHEVSHRAVVRREARFAEVVAEMLHEHAVDPQAMGEPNQVGELAQVLPHRDDHHPDVWRGTGESTPGRHKSLDIGDH